MCPTQGDWDDYGEWLDTLPERQDDAELLADLEASRLTPPEFEGDLPY